MTIHLSKDVENSIIAAVQSGQFASADEMVDKLVREYSQRIPQQPLNASKPVQRVKRPKAKPQQKSLTIDEIHQQMLANGLITRLPNPAEDIDDDDPDDLPVPIEGEPLSETIIRERR